MHKPRRLRSTALRWLYALDTTEPAMRRCSLCSCWQIGETYDWRLAVPNMERRDGYFTRLKVRVETTHQLHGEKVAPCLRPARTLLARGMLTVCCQAIGAGGL